MTGQIQWTVALLFIGLFCLAIIGFATHFAQDNNSAIDISNDLQINSMSTSTNANLSQFRSDAENSASSILSSTIAPGSTTTAGAGPYSITSGTLIGSGKKILLLGYEKMFGSKNDFGIFMTTFLAIISFITFAYVVKLWRAGIPD